MTLHGPHADVADLAERVVRLIHDRTDAGPDFGRTAPPGELAGRLTGAITAGGLGVARAWDVFEQAVSANTVALDGPRYLGFIPMSPAVAAVWMDAVVGATSFAAESWLEASGAVAAENQALDHLRRLAGMPDGAGGAFCSGGSIGNLSALAVARDVAGGRRLVAVADTAHSSVDNALHLLGLEALVVPTGVDGRFTGVALTESLAASGRAAEVAIVVAAAGSTNAGVIDDLRGLADVAHAHDAWLHVDGAYGGAALELAECRDRFAGLGDADSFIVDPHKWLFATAGSCAVLYRDPGLARRTHTQHGPYIDVLHHGDADNDATTATPTDATGTTTATTDATTDATTGTTTGTPTDATVDDGGLDWNPSDHAFQLTRRASGLPFWFTLVVHGTSAMAEAVRAPMATTRYAVDRLRATPGVEVLLEPELTVVLFRRAGWDRARWQRWSSELIERRIAFVAPTTWKGETVGRLVFLHPATTTDIVDEVVATLREP